MRNTHELLKLLRNHMDMYFSAYHDGMCIVVSKMCYDNLINVFEKNILLDYIERHRPINILRNKISAYYWKPGRIRPRMRWLNKHIKLSDPYKNINVVPLPRP